MATDLLDLLRRAQTASQRGDNAVLQRALAQLDADARAGVDSSFFHFVMGRILVWLGREDDGLRSFNMAISRDVGNAHARYQRGLLLAGRGDEAAAYQDWASAFALDPSFEDAAYNAGQAAYNLGHFEDALRFFEAACAARPEDFEAAKKKVQALRALARHPEAEQATADLVAMWRRSTDAAVQRLNDVVIDQFRVAGALVFAWQNLRPAREDLHYELTFAVQGQALTVQLESSAYGRERGMPYLLGMTQASQHRTTGPGFPGKPPYDQVKSLVLPMLEKLLGATPQA